jgi:hypothetical protein
MSDESSLPVATAVAPGLSTGSPVGYGNSRVVPAAWFISTKAASARASCPPAPASISLPVGSIPMPFGPSSEIIDDWTPLWRCDSEALEANYLANVSVEATYGAPDERELFAVFLIPFRSS